jgi:GMP synthase-like glutamine amidotransferase
MHALILQHQDDAPAGLVLDALARAGLEPRVAHLDHGDPLPDVGAPAVAITLGSDASVNDTAPEWIARELEWLRGADAAGTPVLGLCFGAQALAAALGGRVKRCPLPERGWVSIETFAPELVAAGPWMSWHDDMIELPRGAELLARNPSGPQAYRLGRHLGLQFHPEVTAEIVEAWIGAYGDGSFDPTVMRAETEREIERAAADAARLFDGFLSAALAARAAA